MKKTAWLAFALALALALNGLALAQGAQVAPITAAEAVERFNGGTYSAFVDVRAQADYDAGHIPTAVNLPLEQLAQAAAEALPDAAQALCDLGYSAVYDLGSLADWPYETITTEKENAPFLGLFTATDIDGNPVDQTLFADYKLTMINVWATYCSPCINEMPDLGRLHADMAAEGVQIVGLVSDALDSSGNISQSQVDLARDIIEATGANYPHMLPSQDLISTVLWQVTAVPTTIFVDHTGELVGYAYAGSRSYDQWTAIIYDTLSLLEDASEETSEPAEESADAAGEAEA